MLTEDQIQAIKAPFPPEALSSDTSRGFKLTAIRAAFVIERFSEVVGLCGIGWRCAYSPFEELHTDNGRVETVTEVAFQYRFPATNDCTGCGQVEQRPGWHHRIWLPSDVCINDARWGKRPGWIEDRVAGADRLPPGVNPARLQATPQFLPGNPVCHQDQMDQHRSSSRR